MTTIRSEFCDQGWAVARGLFPPEEALAIRDHLMAARESGPCQGDDAEMDPHHPDPLRRYPRIVHPHKWDSVSLDYLLDPRIGKILVELMGDEPVGVQTMVYFKPPGARGQALHQDQFYLDVRPATCVAAWMALDDCDEANGGMMLVSGTQNAPLICPVAADTDRSFTTIEVPIPPGHEATVPHLRPGDVLFFNGSLVHGSGPNATTDRWRRALIGHYVPRSTTSVVRWYSEGLAFDGSTVRFDSVEGARTCGDFVESGAFVERPLSVSGPLEAH